MGAGNVGMIEPRGRPGLGLEPPQTFRVAGLPRRQNLHRDRAMQIRIPRPKHSPHSAAADELLQQHMVKLNPLQRLPELSRVKHGRGRAGFDRRGGRDDGDVVVDGRCDARAGRVLRPLSTGAGTGFAVRHYEVKDR
jgi:hypothetical protein